MEYIGETGRNLGERYKEHVPSLPSLTISKHRTQQHTGQLLHSGQGTTKFTRTITIFFLVVSMSNRGALPPLPLLSPTTNFWNKFHPSAKYVHSRGVPFLFPPYIFLCDIFPPNFWCGAKLVSITFSLRPEEIF